MCGITGILHFDSERQINPSKLRKMTTALKHRGPDGEGFFVEGQIGLGHRRLSIIDLSTGDQPMYSEDKSLALVFNGEIYNYIELKLQLESLGHRFRTHSDTEVILKAYQEWGLKCQNMFNGMWAFALWDARLKKLIISRDRIGEKPLNYSLYDNTIVFASEIKSLLAYGIPSAVDESQLELYLTLGFIPAPYTFYKYINKLKAGHTLTVQHGKVTESAYWNLPDIDERNMRVGRQDIIDEFESILNDSVRIRMRSDVPFGAFLSGGLDSASIVSIMARNSDLPIETFTIGFKEKRYDERNLARIISDYYETSHHEQVMSPVDVQEVINKILYHYDEPFADPAAIPTYLVSEFASQHVKMVLTGDGGDEILSGYKAYRGEKFASEYQNLPEIVKRILLKTSAFLSEHSKGSFHSKFRRAHRIINNADEDFGTRLISKDPLPQGIDISAFLPSGTKSVADFLSEVFRKTPITDPFYKLAFYQFSVSLPDRMLLKVDKMSMANSIETRIPFLDYRLVELMYGVDKKVKLPGYKTKTILRESIGEQLPQEILQVPKQGFNVPLNEWFKGNHFENELSLLHKQDFGMSQSKIKNLLEAHRSGNGDYGKFIWKLILYRNWIEKAGTVDTYA